MVKLQDQTISALMDKILDAQQKLDLISSMQQRFTKRKEETNTLSGDSAVKNVTIPDAPKVEAVKPNSTKVEPTKEPVTDKVEPVKDEEQPVKIAQQQKVDKLLNIIGNNPQIIRRNNANELDVNCHAVAGSIFDELYAAILSPKGSEHMAGMTELLCALWQLNVESTDVVSNRIKVAYESAPSRLSVLSHNELVLPSMAVKESKHKTIAQPKNNRKSTSPFEIE